MGMSKSRMEQVYGNFENKYQSHSLIGRYLVGNFIKKFVEFLQKTRSSPTERICEIGCGEGELLKIIYTNFPSSTIHAVDISDGIIEVAKQNCQGIPIKFSVQDAKNLNGFSDGFFDLVICCEVLEHLSDPFQGLKELSRISNKFILISVPVEPVWRLLNMMRGKYLRTYGNTPGHLNHWKPAKFKKFLNTSSSFKLMNRIYPFPWQMVLLKKG
jgi:ubiquinone/menaquinone biosynthesis C-methylase UbiE